MNFSSSTILSCASDYTVTQMVYSQGELSIEVDFTRDLEGVDCSLSINYDQQLTIINNSSVNFTAISRNEELIIVSEDDVSRRAIIKFIF